ncbi:hypothetical protein [Acuticoccus mangrovi]|uniref:Uncharacterized protein n=1 Tax=Acuticoccus mangrovi TaxID=2796142 RepID=A0A934MFJ0_9HYPH|nr:hypothetical protein [Acuticoccus mangrovi]MBJ3775528.1 hypothetical protein [Acuticoccus mangrovi]
MAKSMVIAALMLPLAGPAVAQTFDGRFQIEPVHNGALRLDRDSGAIELCTSVEDAKADGWSCEEVVAPNLEPADASRALAAENRQLKRRVVALERRLKTIAALATDGLPASERAAETTFSEDARRGIDQAVDVTGYALKRFSDLYRSLQGDEESQ